MNATTIGAHVVGTAIGSGVWLVGLSLPAGTAPLWLQIIGPAGVTALAAVSLALAHHQAAMADASARRRATAAITAARSDVNRDAVDWTRLKSDEAYRSAVTTALARREVTAR